jgi:hypothetical protein
MKNKVPAASKFSRIAEQTARSSFLERGRRCAQYTVREITAEDDQSHSFSPSPDAVPANTLLGLGARGVNNLASKLLLSLLPPGGTMFRLVVENYKLKKQFEEQSEEFLSELEQALSQIEREVIRQIDGTNDRAVLYEALRHLLVVGSTLIYVGPERMRYYPLSGYAIELSGTGLPLEAVTREYISEGQAAALGYRRDRQSVTPQDAIESRENNGILELYTCVEWDWKKGTVSWYQEIEGTPVGSDGSELIEESPWIPLTLGRIAGKSYGYGYVWNLYDDLVTLSALNQAIVEYSSAAARLIFLVNPNGMTNPERLANTPNGGFCPGTPADVVALQMQKTTDLSVTMQKAQRLEQAISLQFLLNSSAIRQSERTTAEEVRMTADELDQSLGGIYAQLSLEFQRPYIRRKMSDLTAQGKLPELPSGLFSIRVTTGLDAIGRNGDAQAINNYLGAMNNALSGPVSALLNVESLAKQMAAAMGVDGQSILKDQQQLEQERQQALMLAQAQASAAGNGAVPAPAI